MKKLLSFGLVLALLLTMLSGCSVLETLSNGKQITSDDLTMTVPALYIDLTATVGNDALSFVYGINDTAVLGVQESREDILAAYAGVDTTEEYAQVFLDANGKDAQISEKKGITTFTYTGHADGREFTYLCGVFANDTNFWVVQTYCYSENFSKNEADFWDILRSVEV